MLPQPPELPSALLPALLPELPELLPESVLRDFGLVGAREAYRAIHFPEDFASLEQARRRFVFEELFLLSCALGMRRQGQLRLRVLALRYAGKVSFCQEIS